MKFSCEKSVLLKVLTSVSRCVSVRSNIQSLEGIHITVENSQVYFESFNMEFGVKTSILVNESEDGSIVIPAKIFTDITKKLPDSLINIESEGLNVHINCLNSSFVISSVSASEFPNLPSVENENPIVISSGTLKSMIQNTIFAVADDNENKSIHAGELWKVSDKVLTVVAVDGFRMAVRREAVNISDNFEIVIPGKALSEVVKLLPNNKEDDIKIYLSERYAFFEFENYFFLSRLLDGNFIDYNSAIPSEYSTKIGINVEDTVSTLERVSVVISDRLQTSVKAIFDPSGSIKFSCSTPLGSSSDSVEADIKGKELSISFNDRYFTDALKHCDSDRVFIEATSPVKPMKIVPVDGDSFVYLVLPVRVNEN